MATIAVVDDNAGARLFAAAALKKAGHEVQEIEPSCLFKVLEALHPAPPDLLVSDLMMPGCPGQTLIRACREDPHLRDLKILLLTAHGDVELAHFLQSMGNTHYLTKPVAPALLSECVDHFLNGELDIDAGWSLACNGVVAVVDDSNLSRVYHSACLRKHGFRPVPIEPSDLMGTLSALEAARPNLLLLDYLMPNFRGDALLRALRGSSLRDLPVVLVTAHHGDELQLMREATDRIEILFKPALAEDLIEKVKAMLATGQPRPGAGSR